VNWRPGALLAIAVLLSAPNVRASEPLPDKNYIRDNARGLPPLGRLPDPVAADLTPYRAILFGEVHGTREAPRLAHEIARAVAHAGRPAWLGLEMSVTEQGAIDRFRQSGDINILKQMPFFRRAPELQDGRSSAATAQFLVMAQKLPELKIYCLDPYGATSAQGRDTGMAREVARRLAENPGSVAVTLTGKVHAAVKAGAAWDPTYRPMGYEIAHGVLPAAQVLAVQLEWQQGTAWNIITKPGEPDTRGVHALPIQNDNYANALPWGAYFLKLPSVMDGFGGVLFWRTLSASPPFVPPPPQMGAPVTPGATLGPSTLPVTPGPYVRPVSPGTLGTPVMSGPLGATFTGPVTPAPIFRPATPATPAPIFRPATPETPAPTFRPANPATPAPTFRPANPATPAPTYRPTTPYR
jgi:hypothetical protein